MWVSQGLSHTAFIGRYHVVRTSHAHFQSTTVQRGAGVCFFLAGPLWKVYRQRKPLAECRHNISIRQIYGYSFAEERPCEACRTFSVSPLLSCPACSEVALSLRLVRSLLFTARAATRPGGSVFTPVGREHAAWVQDSTKKSD